MLTIPSVEQRYVKLGTGYYPAPTLPVGRYPLAGQNYTMVDNYITHGIILLLYVVCSVSPVYANNVTVPVGWRYPKPKEINQDWRKKSPVFYTSVNDDFNGDGLIDNAAILIRKNVGTIGLFVFISGKSSPILLDQSKPDSIMFMGVSRVTPGKYQTACGKGYWKCSKEETPEIQINHMSINYFASESANSYFYFDRATNSFKRIWISD